MNNAESDAQAPPLRIPDELHATIAGLLGELDRAGAVKAALDAVAAEQIGIADLYTQVLGPYLNDLGSRWRHGHEAIWQEHFASHVVRTIVEALYPQVVTQAAEVAPHDQVVLLVCPPNEEHELGLRMLADRFELAGHHTVFLGADTPVAEIVQAASTVHATIVALSVSTMIERVELRRFIDALRAQLAGIRIIVGGPAVRSDPDSWPLDERLDPAEFGLPGAPPTR